jgi:hypothetical protein
LVLEVVFHNIIIAWFVRFRKGANRPPRYGKPP